MREKIKAFFNYLGFAVFLFITGALYYFIFTEGIGYFYYPVLGIFICLLMPIGCVIYYLKFIRK